MPIDGLLINPDYQHILTYPTEILACKCKAGNLLILVITGFGVPVFCGHCGKGYLVESINPDGSPLIRVLPAQPGTRQM